LRYVESRVRVRYKETDQMGIAHHSNYLVWFEIGRTDLCRQTGIPYDEIERRGYLLVVTEIACRYRTPFRYDEEVVIRTSVGEVASRAMRFEYELYDASGIPLRRRSGDPHQRRRSGQPGHALRVRALRRERRGIARDRIQLALVAG
jgi:YbgC/YbaW family acyl-CoA thioester hydrolase